jgi:hypothetical protein
MPEKKRLLATVPKGGEWDPLSLDQRKLVEEAYGQGPLSQVVWLKIEAATALYNSGAAVERAVPMDEFRRKLTKLRAAAGEVNRCLPEMSHRVYKSIDPQLTGIERQLAIQEKYFELDEFDRRQSFPSMCMSCSHTHWLPSKMSPALQSWSLGIRKSGTFVERCGRIGFTGSQLS